MKVIQPNCRIQFTAEDVDFIVSILGKKTGNAQCLTQLLADEESRDLILRYYEGPSEARIGNRKALSELLGIPLNALRIRSYRLRARLESCVEKCLKAKEEEMDTDFSHKRTREQS